MALYTMPITSGDNHYFQTPVCPVCGDILLAPNMSLHVNERRVRHVWSCEECGYVFDTAVDIKMKRRRTA